MVWLMLLAARTPHSQLHRTIDALGFNAPTSVQEAAYQHLAQGNDAVLLAEAGAGKTLAYLLPLLARAQQEPTTTLVAVPTHDLALQLVRVAATLGAKAKRVGAAARDDELVVGTAVEVAPLVRAAVGGQPSKRAGSPPPRPRRRLQLVLDEADFLLAGLRRKGRGVADAPAMQLLDAVRHERSSAGSSRVQLVLVSATIPGQSKSSVGALIDSKFPRIRWIRTEGAHRPMTSLSSRFVEVADDARRREVLLELVGESRVNRTLVFANSVSRVKEVVRLLQEARVPAAAYHPDVPVEARERSLSAFGSCADGVLVCSGLAARGLDFPEVGLVVQYQLAPHMLEYVHRVGRTARGGRPGVAVSLFSPEARSEVALVREVERCVRGSWKWV